MNQKYTNVNTRKINVSLPAAHIHDIFTAKCLLQRDNTFIHYQGFSPYSNFKFAASKIPTGIQHLKEKYFKFTKFSAKCPTVIKVH